MCCDFAAQVRHIVSNLTHGTWATTGETMYFGSPQSQTLLRIHDKRLEFQSKGQETQMQTLQNVKRWESDTLTPSDTTAPARYVRPSRFTTVHQAGAVGPRSRTIGRVGSRCAYLVVPGAPSPTTIRHSLTTPSK